MLAAAFPGTYSGGKKRRIHKHQSSGAVFSSTATELVVHMGRAFCVFLLLAALVTEADLSAQAPPEPPESGFTLGQNYPNPFNPETRIPFELNEGLFVDGRTAMVSVRIYNVLQQFVAAPTALNHPSGQTPLVDLEHVAPGRYEAYWDGLDQAGRKVASGIYFVQLTVNGERAVIRMYVTK